MARHPNRARARAKLTASQAKKVVELYFSDRKITQTFLARKFRTSQASISNLINGLTYQDITGIEKHGRRRPRSKGSRCA